MQKLRATDVRQNAMIPLPPPMISCMESEIVVRTESYKKIFKEYIDRETKKGRQRQEITRQEKAGIYKLKKRIKEGEVIVSKTDKTGKLAVQSRAAYEKGGQEHTEKDTLITRQDTEKIQDRIYNHTSMWLKMMNADKDHNHTGRIRGTMLNQDASVPPMYMLIKDHKPVGDSGGPNIRLVVSGNV